MSDPAPRRTRRTARVILLGPGERVLLFRYLAPGFDPFWILPGGECETGEDYPAAARRELHEETGIHASPAPLDIVREANYVYDGEPVRAIEHFFVHRISTDRIDTRGHTELERQVMQEHRWFTCVDVGDWPETIYPSDIVELVALAYDRHGVTSP